MNQWIKSVTIATLLGVITAPALAVPSLQLHIPGGSWDPVTETWVHDASASSTFILEAYAVDQDLGSAAGDAFEDNAGSHRAWLAGALLGNYDGTEDSSLFGDITINGVSIPAGLGGWQYGTPPISDANSLAPHGIFPTWFFAVQFSFGGGNANDDVIQTNFDNPNYGIVEDVGFERSLSFDVSGLNGGLTSGLHFDLYTLDSNDQVHEFTSVSHDAATIVQVTLPPDGDGDGVPDVDDNCPNDANPGQEDFDGDAVGDACDDDVDGDGVDNDIDNCPTDPNAGQEDFDNDNIGDACDDDIDGDSVVNDEDFCPDNTVIPESVPMMGDLNPNHWALTVIGNGFDFDTVTKGKGKGPNRSYTIEDTAGCSCEQIIEIQGLGRGHTLHGCSISAMDDWLEFVNP